MLACGRRDRDRNIHPVMLKGKKWKLQTPLPRTSHCKNLVTQPHLTAQEAEVCNWGAAAKAQVVLCLKVEREAGNRGGGRWQSLPQSLVSTLKEKRLLFCRYKSGFLFVKL